MKKYIFVLMLMSLLVVSANLVASDHCNRVAELISSNELTFSILRAKKTGVPFSRIVQIINSVAPENEHEFTEIARLIYSSDLMRRELEVFVALHESCFKNNL